MKEFTNVKVNSYVWGKSMYGGWYLEVIIEDNKTLKCTREIFRSNKLQDVRCYMGAMYNMKLSDTFRKDNI